MPLWGPIYHSIIPDSKVHVAHMGPTWVLSAPGGPHVGPMNLAINDVKHCNGSRIQSRLWLWTDKRHSLTHWGRVTHMCVSDLPDTGSDNGLSPSRRQAIIWTNAGLLLIRTLGTNFSEILCEINTFSFNKMCLKISSANWRPFISASMWYLCLTGKPKCIYMGTMVEMPMIWQNCTVFCFRSV